MVTMWLILVKIFPVITGGRNVSISVRTKYKERLSSFSVWYRLCCPAGIDPISIFRGAYTVWVLCMTVETLLHSQADNPKQIRSLIAPYQYYTIKLARVLRFCSVAISQNLAKVAKNWRSKKEKRGRRWTFSLSHFCSNAYSTSSVLNSHLCPRGNPRYHFPS